MEIHHSLILGAVEGLTEFLPVSSTGHLILASRLLQLKGEAVKSFEIIIQCGAIAAVAGLYHARVKALIDGLLGRDARGRRLLLVLLTSFFPAVVAGLLLHDTIKAKLFSTWPVVWALAAGGAVMIVIDRYLAFRNPRTDKTLYTITLTEALVVGLAQCLALWPGTSRAMTTILAGLLLGWPPVVAAEYSFLLALPTLGAAAGLDAVKNGSLLISSVGWASLAVGFLTAMVVAMLAMRAFVGYLTHRGLAPFGWYRIALAGAIWIMSMVSL